jgi:hypothetical protein
VVLSFLIVTRADNKTITYNCKIVTDFTINEDRIMYSFKGKNYIIGITHQQTLAELRNKYYPKVATKTKKHAKNVDKSTT